MGNRGCDSEGNGALTLLPVLGKVRYTRGSRAGAAFKVWASLPSIPASHPQTNVEWLKWSGRTRRLLAHHCFRGCPWCIRERLAPLLEIPELTPRIWCPSAVRRRVNRLGMSLCHLCPDLWSDMTWGQRVSIPICDPSPPGTRLLSSVRSLQSVPCMQSYARFH